MSSVNKYLFCASNFRRLKEDIGWYIFKSILLGQLRDEGVEFALQASGEIQVLLVGMIIHQVRPTSKRNLRE